MLENRRLRLVIIMILVSAVVGAALAMPLWIEQFTGTTRPEESSKDPFYTPTSELDNVTLSNNVVEATSTPTNTSPPPKTGENNCVHDISYWLSHRDTWPFEEIRISDKSFSKAEAVLIIESDTQDPAQLLLRQLFIYTLNIQYGADQRNILDEVIEAHNWINTHPAGGVVSEQDMELAYELVNVLSEFNQGNFGPGLCPEMTDTPAPTPTRTLTSTQAVTTTLTTTPSATATRTTVSDLPSWILTPVPEVPPKPDKPPKPTEPPPEPTEPPPEPTEPPPPPVEPTQPPPPTAASTKVELPTEAPTPEP